ncbi:MAG: hypothetical protein IH969_08980 [Candidatus Krumholzibacteriota bacterium]|nr:hypothetical protein [Candidatus Krumholzibacteriota bacterium]
MKHKRVLDYVNRIRKALGYKPRKTLAKGIRGKASICPIACSIPVVVFTDSESMVFLNPGIPKNAGIVEEMQHPQYVTDFIDNFDDGKYPELIKKESS